MSDLIDRWAAIALIHSLYPSAPIMRMNRKRWEKKYEPYIEAEKALEQMPSAQLPKGEWFRMSDLSEKDDDRYKCSRCGNVVHHESRVDLYTFNSWCGRCGSDNSRHTYRKENRWIRNGS